MRWRYLKQYHQEEVRAYIRHLLEQDALCRAGRLPFKSLLEEVPGRCLREKLLSLAHGGQDRVFRRCRPGTRKRLRTLREAEVSRQHSRIL